MNHPPLQTPTRWLVRRDLAEVLAIERQAFDDPWDEPRLLEELANLKQVGYVAEDEGEVVGYVLYERQPARLVVRRLAVAADFHRRGVGRQLIERCVLKLDVAKLHSLHVPVHESWLAAQLWLRALGLTCVRTLRDAERGDTYLFRYRLRVD